MNATARRIIMGAGLGTPYRSVRTAYHSFRVSRNAKRIFRDPYVYLDALRHEGEGTCCVEMRDGLKFEIRRNRMDASILAEVFLDKDYGQGLALPDGGSVIDIGGYIADFAVYAVKYLRAKRVITIEPSPQNWGLLRNNIRLNGYGDHITAIQAAVTDGRPIKMDLGARNQARVSSYYGGSELAEVPGISLATLLELHGIAELNLLKIDCEGGEYQILLSTGDETLARVRNLVFEFHEIDGFAPMLQAVKRRLGGAGFQLTQRGHLITAVRSSPHN